MADEVWSEWLRTGAGEVFLLARLFPLPGGVQVPQAWQGMGVQEGRRQLLQLAIDRQRPEVPQVRPGRR
jgi:hypothetical protein